MRRATTSSTGVPAERISYDPAKFEARIGDQRIWFGNLYAICERCWPWQRRKVVRGFLRPFLEAPTRPTTFPEARNQLLPGLRDAFVFDTLALESRLGEGQTAAPAGNHLGSRLRVALLIDSE